MGWAGVESGIQGMSQVTSSEGMGRNIVHLFPAKREEGSLRLAVQEGRTLHRIPDECFFCLKLIRSESSASVNVGLAVYLH